MTVSSTPPQGAVKSQVHEPTVTDLLNEAPTSKFHRRTVIISGVGFFTDAYDLFVIGTAAALVAAQWHLSTLQTSWVTGAAILGAFVGAFTFGRIADVIGRKKVYVTVAVIMIFGAVASALAPDFIFLVIARLVLGLGIGGDYPDGQRIVTGVRALREPTDRT
jgi:MFS family permease